MSVDLQKGGVQEHSCCCSCIMPPALRTPRSRSRQHSDPTRDAPTMGLIPAEESLPLIFSLYLLLSNTCARLRLNLRFGECRVGSVSLEVQQP